ncbi:hypothetical protein QYM36_016231 [Artemia franciscana]|uniref:Uncharacterized protein n=1 Tax=Artemia franciscana TaxID=6661 RepID=A0AA88HER9_ARTSF|nr:hypothetical protein QYM36_016231 [Artemia franciscana]
MDTERDIDTGRDNWIRLRAWIWILKETLILEADNCMRLGACIRNMDTERGVDTGRDNWKQITGYDYEHGY